MDRVYELPLEKKAEVTKLLEAEPYAADSFARVGYKLRDGKALGEDEKKLFIYMSGSADFIKKADEKLKAVAAPPKSEIEQRIITKIKAEEEAAEGGFGSLFG
ncbi:Uncharacterised protein [uncultured archaeon]|nr:Uncharacterised protein [uncultured archaeon]